MKSFRQDAAKRKTLEYPIMMEAIKDKIVVLFTSESTGTVISNPRKLRTYDIGHFSDKWIHASNNEAWKVADQLVEVKSCLTSTAEFDYPCLMETSRGLILLCVSPESGVLLTNDGEGLGYTADGGISPIRIGTWYGTENLECTPYDGTVFLENFLEND